MTPYELRDGATGEQALEALRHAANGAQNVGALAAGKASEQILSRYLDWTEEAERMLGNAFALDVVSDLVHTDNYWALRASSSDTPRLIALVLRELESRRRRYDSLVEALTKERRRWQHPSAMLVVPDTNMFLEEGAPFQDIEWPKAVESQGNVRLVVPIVVVHELDRLKRQGNSTTAKLARAATRWLLETLPLQQPNAQSLKLAADFPETHLEVHVEDLPTRPEDADGLIIRFARRLSQVSGQPTKLVTRDLGMRLRASLLGVDAVQLPG